MNEDKARKILTKRYGAAGLHLLLEYIYPTWRKVSLGLTLERFIEVWFNAAARKLYYARTVRDITLHGKLVKITWEVKNQNIKTRLFETSNVNRKRNIKRFGRGRYLDEGQLILIRRDVNQESFDVDVMAKAPTGQAITYTFKVTQSQFDRLRPSLRRLT